MPKSKLSIKNEIQILVQEALNSIAGINSRDGAKKFIKLHWSTAILELPLPSACTLKKLILFKRLISN